jgi:hypothetical protein
MKALAKLLPVLILLLVILAFALVAIPARPGSRTRAYLGIVNTLRQIDGAKQQYAIEHHSPPETVLSWEQLLQYIPDSFWNPHATYKINAVSEAPEAVLPAAFDHLPANTIIRLQTNGTGYQIISPNKPATGNARSALQFAIARRWPGLPEPGC